VIAKIQISLYGVTSQRIVQPTNTLICKDCGQLER